MPAFGLGAVGAGVLGPAAAAYGGIRAHRRFAETDLALTRIGTAADATDEQIKNLNKSVRDLAFESGKSFDEVASGLDSLVAAGMDLPDARNFPTDTASRDLLADRDHAVGDGDDRGVAELLIDQVEFADVIVVNKVDLITDLEREFLTLSLKQLNPDADLIFSKFGKIPLDRILNTKKFSYERASRSAGWLQELEGRHHAPETEEYGFRSFVYRARRPFHPDRFHRFITADWPGVIRAKGFFWLASRMAFAGSLSRAGAIVRHEPAGIWWAATEKHNWPADPEWRAGVLRKWDQRYGDRRQEIVVIGGPDMDQEVLVGRLDACLLTEAEMALGPRQWTSLRDPFPGWRRGVAA